MFDYLIGQIIYSVQESSDDELYHYAQRMYVRTYHEENRKIVDVSIQKDERIELYVPMKFDSSSDLKIFMDEHGIDILAEKNRRLDEETEAVSSTEPLTYDSNLPFLGEYLPIKVIDTDDTREVFVQDGVIHMKAGLSSDGIRASLLKLCRNKAYEYFKPKVDHYAKVIGVSYSRLEIDDGRRTWGMFHDIEKHIILSRRLMMMSAFIIDSIVVHELAHGLTLSHGENHDFEMSKILPDYEERDEAFYETCGLLLEQGWI